MLILPSPTLNESPPETPNAPPNGVFLSNCNEPKLYSVRGLFGIDGLLKPKALGPVCNAKLSSPKAFVLTFDSASILKNPFPL